MLTLRALEIWDYIRATEATYEWQVGPKARAKLELIFEGPVSCWRSEDAGELNRNLRKFITELLNNPKTDSEKIAQLYGWIVADWGGVHRGRAEVEAWSVKNWHPHYRDEPLLIFADEAGNKRVSSWSKVFAFAAPDRHAIYDSRVAVALNLALENLNEQHRFFMPPSRVNRVGGVPQPNAVARARDRLKSHGTKGLPLGYRHYLTWAGAVRDQTRARGDSVDLLTIESTLFASAPLMAAEFEATQ
jgi:hypothetical protein